MSIPAETRTRADHGRATRRPAIDGGTPYLDQGPFEDPGICVEAADDVAAVVRNGRTCYWGGGPKATELEQTFAGTLGRRHAFFHHSGSSALITAVFAVGATAGRSVVIGSAGFVAAVNALYYNNARPVFLPTDPRTLLCTVEGFSPEPSEQPAALLVTHFLGNVVDVPAIAAAVDAEHVIEDAGQAHGASLGGRPVGAWSSIGSFAGSHKKLVTAGQGGLNACDSDHLLSRMRMISHHGKSDRHVGEVPGFNFRGGEMEAVLALHAMRHLEQRVAQRNATAAAITAVLRAAGLATAELVDSPLPTEPSWFDVGIVLPPEWGKYRDWFVAVLQAENIPMATYPSLIEMPWVKPWMQSRGWWGDREEATLEHDRAVWDRVLVIGTQMSPEDGRLCAEGIVEVLQGLPAVKGLFE